MFFIQYFIGLICFLLVQVKEHDKKTQLGIFNLPLSRLLDTSDMTLDQRFVLERSGANSQIQLKATLRVSTQRWQALGLGNIKIYY